MTGFEAYRRWKVALESAGVPHRPFHSMRHAFNTALVDGGMAPEMVRAVVGHRNAAMTASYTHSTDEARQRAVDIIERKLGAG